MTDRNRIIARLAGQDEPNALGLDRQGQADPLAAIDAIQQRIQQNRRLLAALAAELTGGKNVKTKQTTMPQQTPEQMLETIRKLSEKIDRIEVFLIENFPGVFQPAKPGDKARKTGRDDFWK